MAVLIKEETGGNVIIEEDRITMKCRMENKQGSINFDVENSIVLNNVMSFTSHLV